MWYITSRLDFSFIQNYEEESKRQRKQMAEIRKSLSLSRSSMESSENPPPMGYGGPEFAKNKAKLSKECKMQRDVPIPPVDQGGFNDEGDCVLEGNVLQQIKVSEFFCFRISFVSLDITIIFQGSSRIMSFFLFSVLRPRHFQRAPVNKDSDIEGWFLILNLKSSLHVTIYLSLSAEGKG